MKITIDRKRLVDEFLELTAIDSLSLGEREIADRLITKLKNIGFEVFEDDAGKHYGGNAGNIYAFLNGSKNTPPVLFSAHMDTVSPGIGKKAIVHEDGKITSNGTTVLGSDDAAGLVEILEGIRSIRESGVEHGDIEILFPIAEEVYIKGTDKFDFKKIRSKQAYVLDISGDVGAAAVKAPSLISFKITVTGRSAHAGFSNESGINAIAIAGKALSCIKQGRIDDDTTLNIGTITGGEATNIVPGSCVCCGEVRSFDHQKALEQIKKLESSFRETAEKTGAAVDITTCVNLVAYEVEKDEPVIQRFLKSCKQIGIDGKLVSTFGGSDNHNFVLNGIKGIVISCGMYNIHSTSEYTKVDELEKGAELVASLIING